MPSIQIKSEISINELLSSVEKLDTKSIDHLIKKLIAFQIKRKASQPSKVEAQLLKRITRKLPKTKQTKYEQLTQKRLNETINGKELKELGTLIDLIEKIDAEKAQAIFTLSQIRGISPTELMTNLNLS